MVSLLLDRLLLTQGIPNEIMNFSAFGNHFPAISAIHQQFAKFPSHESGSPVSGVGTQTSLGEEPNRFTTTEQQFNNAQHQSSTGLVKYSRDSSTQVSSGNLLCPSPPTKYPDQIHYQSNNQYHIHEEKRNGYDGNLSHQDKRDKKDYTNPTQQQPQPQQPPGMPPSWQSIAAPGSTVADYLSHLPASTLPISLHHFLKYSAESIKKDQEMETANHHHHHQHIQQQSVQTAPTSAILDPSRRKRKKKPPKEKKPRPKPGEIRMTTALDGTTLYCCPECHMAYPDKSLLEQHLLGHTMERRFFCDVCGAGLKRKDHLTRHKQSHNPERPFVCTVCMKAFKRKEQLTLHFVIHSGEKRHVCTECGKGFYRKDHLRKHTRSHIARRVKAELSQHVPHPTPQHDPSTGS